MPNETQQPPMLPAGTLVALTARMIEEGKFMAEIDSHIAEANRVLETRRQRGEAAMRARREGGSVRQTKTTEEMFSRTDSASSSTRIATMTIAKPIDPESILLDALAQCEKARSPVKILVTPEIAKYAIGLIPNGQRLLRKPRVAAIAADIVRGHWDGAICNPIRISSDLKLIDGQHRMHAVVLAEKTVPMWIELRESFEHIDECRARNFTDNLGMSGVANATMTAAVVRAYMFALDARATGRDYGVIQHSSPYSNSRMAEMVNSRPEIFTIVTEALRLVAHGRKSMLNPPFTAGSVGAFLLLSLDDCGSHGDQSLWLESIASDIGHEHGDSALAYRRWSLGYRALARRTHELPALIRCWNAHARGEVMKTCKGQSQTKIEKILPRRAP